MQVFRPLVLSLLAAFSVSPLVTAQSLTKESALRPDAQASAELFSFLQPFDIRAITPRSATPAADSKDDSPDMPPKNLGRQRILTLEEDGNEPICYTLRTYRVARESPDSDSTKPAGYSTCQRASRFQLKTAVDLREIAPR
jgi:hypothetical protein